MSDPFSPNSKSQLVREARFGLSLVAVLLILFVYVAYYRITGQGRQIPEHVRLAPVSQPVWPYEKQGDPKRKQPRPETAKLANARPRSFDVQNRKSNARAHSVPDDTTGEKKAAVGSGNGSGNGNSTANWLSRNSDSNNHPEIPPLDIQLPPEKENHQPPTRFSNSFETPLNRSNPARRGNSKFAVNAVVENSRAFDGSFPTNVADDPFLAMIKNVESTPTSIKSASLQTDKNQGVATQAGGFEDSLPTVSKRVPKQSPPVAQPGVGSNSPINFNQLRNTTSRDKATEFPPVNSLQVQNHGQNQFGPGQFGPGDNQFNGDTGFQPMALPSNEEGTQGFQPSSSQAGQKKLPTILRDHSSRGSKWESQLPPTHKPERARAIHSEPAPPVHDHDLSVPPKIDEMTSPAKLPEKNGGETDRPRPNDSDSESFGSMPQANGSAAFYIVQPGDSFWTISQTRYGDGRFFRALYQYNQSSVSSFDELVPGTRVDTPAPEDLTKLWPDLCPASEVSLPVHREFPIYTTRQGDTLFEIARQRLGQASRYLEILELNYSRLNSDANHLTPLPAGIQLFLPE